MTANLGSAKMAVRAISMDRMTDLQSRLSSREVTPATRAHHALARWLVTTETGAAEGPQAGAAAAERVFEKLGQRLAQLITPVGSEALLRRAAHLSRTEFPFLDGVQGAPNTDPLVDRLRETAATVEPGEAYAGFVVLLATLVALLESFIGKDLTFRILRNVWTELPMSHSPS
jgi:hypothetical protein